MPKEKEKIEGTVCRPFLHGGKHCEVGSDLEVPVEVARMLENSKRFTTDKDARAQVKARAKVRAKSGSEK